MEFQSSRMFFKHAKPELQEKTDTRFDKAR